jgi:sacsin
MEGGVALPFLGTVIRCPLRSVPSRISDEIVQSNVISTLFQEFMDQEMGISCLFLNNVSSIEIHEISSTGGLTLLAKMDISRSDHASSTMSTVVVQLDRIDRVSERKEWHVMQSDFSRDEAINNSSTVGVLQGAIFSPQVKIAVDITSTTTRGRLFSFLPLPIYTGFPVHIHGSFGIDASRANLRRNSVGLASGSRDQ